MLILLIFSDSNQHELNKINLQGFTSRSRNEIIEELKQTISTNGGYILNFNFYSDLAISFTIEIEEQHLMKLYRGLSQVINVNNSFPSHLDSDSNKDYWVLLSVSFTKGTGDYRIDIPEVPG